MKHLRIIFLLLVFVFTATVYAVQEVSHITEDHTDTTGKVTLTVKVVNATESGTKVEGDKLFVTIYHYGQKHSTIEAEVDSAGKAVFKDIPTGLHFQAVSRAKHSDMMFGSRPVNLDSGEDVTAKVEVYDVSFDNSVLSIGSHDINVKIAGKSLLVTEYLQLINPTDKAVSSSKKGVNDKPIVSEMSLPAGFSEFKCIQYFKSNALVVTKDGFYDTMAIPPGTYNAAFTYKIDFDGPLFDFQKKITMPTEDLQVFSQLDGGVLEGLGPIVGMANAPDGARAQKYPASAYKAGDMLIFRVKGEESSKLPKIIITAVVVLALFVGVLILLSKKNQQVNAKA